VDVCEILDADWEMHRNAQRFGPLLVNAQRSALGYSPPRFYEKHTSLWSVIEFWCQIGVCERLQRLKLGFLVRHCAAFMTAAADAMEH
jgi:hypothetical protein